MTIMHWPYSAIGDFEDTLDTWLYDTQMVTLDIHRKDEI